VVRDDKHWGRLRELGASEVIFWEGASNWGQDVISVTGGRGVDVVVNVAGGETLASSIAATALGGTIHLMGYASGKTVAFEMFEAIRHAVTFKVAAAGSRKSFESMTKVMELEDIRPPISQRFAVTAYREAFEALSHGGHFGKVILTF
jgi:NADPH:quinone reductase-like Zn-dependent oxidoreductase